MTPGHSNDAFIQAVRDEFSRMRAHLFEAAEAAGWPTRQEKGWKGVIRTITYDSQSSIEAFLRREATQPNGGPMVEPGITSAHIQTARKARYGEEVNPPPPPAETEILAEGETVEAETKTKTTKTDA
jgi:hypothetical protein